MGEFDDVKLFFSIVEKKTFLEKHGYVIERIHVDEEVNIYQNSWLTMHSIKDVAKKDGEQYDIHELFLKLIKNKILGL